MAQSVAGELYESITGQLFEIGRQIRQPKGYPYDPAKLQRHLQNAIEGHFGDAEVSAVVKIDRSTPFSPAEFIDKGWSIWRGPADGDGLTGEEDQDVWSLALTGVDFSQVHLVSCLNEEEKYITGEEKLRRLKGAEHIRLDAKVFQTLWENQHLIPESWKEKMDGGATFIFFDGTILRSPVAGRRRVLCLFWPGGGWVWSSRWLGDDWDVGNQSAVLGS